MVLYLNKDHYFTLRMGGGFGTNTKSELLSLWGLLQFAILIGISDICIFGYSKVIIDWINGKSNIQVLQLKQWSNKVKPL